MTTNDLLEALARLRVETGSLACLGCGHEHNCSTHGCAILRAAADLIERLTAENVVLPDGQASAIETLHKEIEWKDMVIALAQKEQAKAETERDALLPYAKEYGCETCKNEKACFVQTREGVTVSCVECPVPDTCPCSQCKDCGKWEWRGLPAAPEEGEKA